LGGQRSTANPHDQPSEGYARDDAWAAEVRNRDRFRFGDNWNRFVLSLTEDRRSEARAALELLLGLDDLSGMDFLDIGSGSGLHSLTARELGATVRSIDYDTEAVAATSRLRDRLRPGDADWVIEQGSALDGRYLASLGTFDVVYSWGVLHHTGAMWDAIANVLPLVKQGGLLALAIYNDQGRGSRRALAMKRRYVQAGRVGRAVEVARFAIPQTILGAGHDIVRGRNPLTRYRRRERGMSIWHDILDWVGGYPFEVAKPELVIEAVRSEGFDLTRLRTVGGGSGNNEFVFRRHPLESG
jgi:2-polyprenyl-3-methyl-5-hydroxy-6-metoxy-1,4-benzoquinol methylase